MQTGDFYFGTFGENSSGTHIHEVLEQIQIAPFTVATSGLGVLGDRDPRLVWAGIETNEALERLREKVRRAAARSGVDLPRERFRPHVTLARFKGRMADRDRSQLDASLSSGVSLTRVTFDVDRFVMYRSTRHQTGATYDPMVEYLLG
jgi:2'-5' RNA ligase